MIIVARLQSHNGINGLWDTILENHKEMEKEMEKDVRLLYLTQRAKHNDVSLFMDVDNIDVMGDFISNRISTIEEIDGVWIFNMINPKFFLIPQGTTPNLKRYTVTIRVYPKHLNDVYNALCNIFPKPDCLIAYVANSFHLFGDSIMVSIMAKDEVQVEKFIQENIKPLPGILQAHSSHIERTHRLITREEWQKYARLFPEP